MWKRISDYPNVEISSKGIVKTISYQIITKSKGVECKKTYQAKELKPLVNKKNGYAYVYIKNKNGHYDRVLIHRLVAVAFISNPNKLKEVNHKNGIKTDNRVENLEWVSREENIQHAYNIGLIDKHKKSLLCINRKRNEKGEWL